MLRRLLVVNSFNLLLLLLLPLTYGGAETVRFLWFDLSMSGLRLAALITVKSNAAVLLFISLLSTSTVARPPGADDDLGELIALIKRHDAAGYQEAMQQRRCRGAALPRAGTAARQRRKPAV